MFNSLYKKEALARLKRQNGEYQRECDALMEEIESLHKMRKQLSSLLEEVRRYGEKLQNTPITVRLEIARIEYNNRNFTDEVERLEIESQAGEGVNQSLVKAGAAAGVGIAAFGPTAAMAIATTFGTASTGTAIASLSGAAATNAALAWLGGGALAAGGGGMAAGSSFLAMAGPIGWAIGGTALVGAGIMANKKNKEIAQEANDKTQHIKNATEDVLETKKSVTKLKESTIDLYQKVEDSFEKLRENGCQDYKSFSKDDQDLLDYLFENSWYLSEKNNEKID